jgi:hypothetical protein
VESEFGGAEGDRTPDLMNAIHALSQLSYGPVLVSANPADVSAAMIEENESRYKVRAELSTDLISTWLL